ncbi:hypothetical protein SAMN05421509_10177 [Chromohalobacter canadensis]|uniref:Uncharacterized protein n=1 Tax=Chromohalobacter canadensis TaxID=141389 RepID=A0A285VBR2_9GAMM|nr:hypothetical protein [Chromohalobacter canadensis]SOC51018.1 hypothetical protein SAMN05421509_10177 [Chromohalobacter canadensis]
MKKWLAVLLLALPGVAIAQNHEICSLESQQAEVIMDLRQSDVPMRDLVGMMKAQGMYDKITEVMVRVAYERPAARTDKYKQRQKVEFGNAFYQDCINR